MLGAYGFDSSGGSVWAVVNHTGSFTAVPEPTSALGRSADHRRPAAPEKEMLNFEF